MPRTLGSLPSMWASGSNWAVCQTSLLLAKRSRCFCNRMLKATCGSFRVAEAPQGKTIQPTRRTLSSWATLAGPARKPSCQSRQHPPPGAIREEGEVIGRAEVFPMEKSVRVLRMSTPPTPSPGEGAGVPSSLGKVRSLSSTSLREPAKVPHD